MTNQSASAVKSTSQPAVSARPSSKPTPWSSLPATKAASSTVPTSSLTVVWAGYVLFWSSCLLLLAAFMNIISGLELTRCVASSAGLCYPRGTRNACSQEPCRWSVICYEFMTWVWFCCYRYTYLRACSIVQCNECCLLHFVYSVHINMEISARDLAVIPNQSVLVHIINYHKQHSPNPRSFWDIVSYIQWPVIYFTFTCCLFVCTCNPVSVDKLLNFTYHGM